jgi:D-alanyl-D-alanine dipeptidase/carboxypeptidase
MAAGYGFIERYPAGGEALTQIAHEPWHFRYVGYPHAELMRAKGLTLEAYTDYVKEFPYDGAHLEFCSTNRRFEIYHVPVFPDRPAEITIPARARCEISGNNVDGMVVTLW